MRSLFMIAFLMPDIHAALTAAPGTQSGQMLLDVGMCVGVCNEEDRHAVKLMLKLNDYVSSMTNLAKV